MPWMPPMVTSMEMDGFLPALAANVFNVRIQIIDMRKSSHSSVRPEIQTVLVSSRSIKAPAPFQGTNEQDEKEHT